MTVDQDQAIGSIARDSHISVADLTEQAAQRSGLLGGMPAPIFSVRQKL